MKKKSKEKFSFSIEFQLEILRFIIQDPNGILALIKIKPEYLTLIEHSLICEGLKKFTKKYKRIPSKPVLWETLQKLIQTKYVELITKDDVIEIKKLLTDLYNNPLKDADVIENQIYSFYAYVQLKHLNESFDLADYDMYNQYNEKITKIIQESKPKDTSDQALFMVKDTIERQFLRQSSPSVLPCPFKGLNQLTNGGGYPKGAIIVLIDKAKAKKTFTLVNVAKGYLRMKRNVLYVDLENGSRPIMDRMIQSSLSKTKKELYTGEFDELEKKHIRKLKRMKVEFIVKRFPALICDTTMIREEIHKLRAQGIDINVIIVDYGGKMASLQKDKDEFERLTNVYVDLQNLTEEENLDACWTAHHVTREAAKHKTTRYEEGDIASSISIIRSATAIIGLNATADEEKHNVQRMEIVVQRDGKPSGRAVFNTDLEKQKMTELTSDQRKLYDEEYGNKLDEEFSKPKKTEGKPYDKSKKTGDI